MMCACVRAACRWEACEWWWGGSGRGLRTGRANRAVPSRHRAHQTSTHPTMQGEVGWGRVEWGGDGARSQKQTPDVLRGARASVCVVEGEGGEGGLQEGRLWFCFV